MSGYNFQSATAGVNAKPVFQLTTDNTEIDSFTNVLGFALESVGRKPLENYQLEEIARNAVTVAQQLLDSQVYTSIDNMEKRYRRTENLRRSIHHRNANNQIVIYSDARAPNGYPYAGSIEYGFHPWGHSHYVPPRPFLRPALEFAANATRASLEENIKQLLLNYRENTFSFSHFSPSKIIGASHRFWGTNVGKRFSSLDREHGWNIEKAYQQGRGNKDYNGTYNKYSGYKNYQRYGTERRQYGTVWKINK